MTFEFTLNQCCFKWTDSATFLGRSNIFGTFKQLVRTGSAAAKQENVGFFCGEGEDFFSGTTFLSPPTQISSRSFIFEK